MPAIIAPTKLSIVDDPTPSAHDGGDAEGIEWVETMAMENTQPEQGQPTEEAAALHGEQAAEEKYPQPEAVTLDGDTRIATGDDPEDD